MLLLQEPGHAAGRSGLPTQASAPVDPISVEGTAAPGHLDVLTPQDVRVFGQLALAPAGLEPPATAIIDAPVLGRDPLMTLIGMTASGPSQQHSKQHKVELREGLRAAAGRKVVAPADDFGSEDVDQEFLLGASMPMEGIAELVDMPFHAGFAWRDAGLITEQLSLVVLGTSGFPCGIVTDVEAQEVQARWLIPFVKGVSDSGLTRFQFQSHMLEPSRDETLALLGHDRVSMKDDKIIRITNHEGWRRAVPSRFEMLD